MEGKIRIIILILPTLFCCSKRWNPDEQYTSEISSLNAAKLNLYNTSNKVNFHDIKVGDSLSRIISIIGNDYKISASLKNNHGIWMKIEFGRKLDETRIELLLKNNEVINIHKY